VTAPLGIRREDKNRWERRAPLTPDHVRELVREHGVRVRIQPSLQRAFPDSDYGDAGADVCEDLEACGVILAVKEIPVEAMLPGGRYVCFSHVAKGQRDNIPALRRLLDLGCTLLDYEMIVDRREKRLIFFGRHAGYAGMIDTLWALGQRLAWEGVATPFEEVRLAHEYSGLDEALNHVGRLGERIRHTGLPAGLRPIVVAFTGAGNVSQGAQEVFERLPFEELEPDEVIRLAEDSDRSHNVLFKTVLARESRVERTADCGYDPGEYRAHPERYRSALAPYLSHLTVLVNGIFWHPDRPVLVTRAHLLELLRGEKQPKLRVIGDITCDVDGSIAATVRPTTPGDPVYVWDPESGTTTPGVAGRGLVVMAVDNLPCELPVEASEHFGDSLLRFVPPLARCEWERPWEELALPRELRDAIIVHRGELTPPFAYLEAHLAESGGRDG
jgi:saccharopine dehydrogenase (NAD+, L-lysine-forming)